MNDLTNVTYNSEIIDVVEEFDYDTQCEQYNRYFKNWRKNKQNPFAFNFEMNKKESVYIEGRGFKVQSVEDAESEVIGHIMHIMGIAMLIWITIDSILGKTVVELLEHLGLNIHCNFISSNMYGLYGNEKAVITALIAISSLKVLIPVIYLIVKLKIPKEVRFMNVMNRPGELIRSLAMTLAVGTVTCLPGLYSSNTSEVYNYFTKLGADVDAWGQSEFVLYTVYDIIVLPILFGLFYNGAIFGALRQFGDTFAIGVTALVAALLSQDVTDMPAAVFITVIAGCGMLRSGSIYTSFFVRIVYKMYMFAVVMIETNSSKDMFLDKNFFILFVFIVSALIVGLSQILISERSFYASYFSEVSTSKRARFAVKAYPFPAVAILCVLAMILKQVF